MVISYRSRMIAAAAAVVVAVLAIVLAVLWSAVRNVEVDRLDSRLCLEARRLASQPFRGEEMRELEIDVLAKLRLGQRSALGLRIERDAEVHRSPGMPASLDSASLDWRRSPDSRLEAPPPPREPRPRGPANERPDRRPGGACQLASFSEGPVNWHAARVAGPDGSGIVAADTAGASAEVLTVARDALPLAIALALLLAALGAWLISSLAIRPIRRLRDAMHAVSQKDLRQRLESRGEDKEFRELIASYNAMLERLEKSFEQASRFSADAAHELRTPLTILQGRLEQAIRQSEHRAIQADLTDMQDEIGRLASITRKLLLLSQVDAGKLPLNRSSVDLTAELDTLVADAQMLATGDRVTSTIDQGLVVEADEHLLRQLKNNLVSNAIRYCRAGGWIDVAAHRRGKYVEVTFANSAEAIDPENRRRLFDRFHRLDLARGRDSEGTGLGLSLSREIARAHGGDVVFDDGPEDEFRLRLVLPSA
jgi:heavy metal sensor kinase